MTKYTTDGMLLVSKPLKQIPTGYEKTTNPRVYVRKLVPCGHRGWEIIKKPCCGKVKLMYCDKYQRRTNREECYRCQLT